MCVGPTGTGKTLTISDKLTRFMPKEYIPDFIVFSAKTSANQTQDLIDGKLDKRLDFIIFFIYDELIDGFRLLLLKLICLYAGMWK